MMLVKRKAQKIKQIFPLTDGLFTKMTFTFPEGISKSNLDLMFLSNYGKRNPSPVVEIVQSEYGQVLSSSELTQLAGAIQQMYQERWTKLGTIYDIEYDPIHNYLDEWEDESNESNSRSATTSGGSTTTYGKTQTETIQRTDNLTERTVLDEDSRTTKTDDLTKTETRNLATSDSRTDNLSESITYGKTDTRTDNLSESKTYGKTDTRTDNLAENVTYGRTDTRTDNLLQTSSESNQITDNGNKGENVFAFNSTGAQPVSTSSSGNTHTETLGGTVANSGTQAVAESGSDSKSNTGTVTNAESGTDGKTNTGTQTNALSGSDTKANTGTRTTSGTNTGTVTTADTGTETNVGEKDSTRTTTNTGTRTTGDQMSTGGTDRVIKNGTSSEEGSADRDRSGRHFGNIGNLTSQKMILEEINLWKWNYMQEILNDVKDFCTLPVYLNASEWSIVEVDEDD